MAKGWDYSELVKEAKKAGGPENFVADLVEIAKKEGQKSRNPAIIIATILGAGAGAGLLFSVQKLVRFFQKKKAESNKALEEAKQKVIQNYEKNHPDL